MTYKHCPFCDGLLTGLSLTFGLFQFRWNVKCWNCGAEGPSAFSRKAAIKNWDWRGGTKNESDEQQDKPIKAWSESCPASPTKKFYPPGF